MLFELIVNFLILPKIQALISPIQTVVSQIKQPQFTLQKIESDVLDVKITAHSAIAIDALTGQILYNKNSSEQSPIASITKLMTALVVLGLKPNLNNYVTMAENDRLWGGIQHFNIGESITIKDLLAAMLIASDNEAAGMLAGHSGVSHQEFIGLMNKKAKELGMLNTKFIDSSGLDSSNVSTAEDLTKLLAEASKNEMLSKFTIQKGATFKVKSFNDQLRQVTAYTTDALAGSSYLELLAGKTGYLPDAGYCLATKIKSQKDRELFVVVLGSDTILNRFQDVKAIEYYISKNYQ